MTSHEYAIAMQKTAEYILSKPDVDFDSEHKIYLHFWNKDKFVAVVKAMGAGKKEFSSDDLIYKVDGAAIQIRAPRNLVCRKIQEAKYVCEPLFTEKELEELNQPSLKDEVL